MIETNKAFDHGVCRQSNLGKQKKFRGCARNDFGQQGCSKTKRFATVPYGCLLESLVTTMIVYSGIT